MLTYADWPMSSLDWAFLETKSWRYRLIWLGASNIFSAHLYPDLPRFTLYSVVSTDTDKRYIHLSDLSKVRSMPYKKNFPCIYQSPVACSSLTQRRYGARKRDLRDDWWAWWSQLMAWVLTEHWAVLSAPSEMGVDSRSTILKQAWTTNGRWTFWVSFLSSGLNHELVIK